MLYADDPILIGDWNDTNLSNIIRRSWSFNIISGLRINYTKSVLYGVNAQQKELWEASPVLD